MNLPFTVDEFLEIFRTYNLAVWPMQILLNLFAVVAVVLLFVKRDGSKAIGILLSLLWLWTGVVYHIGFFSSINKAASFFGGLAVAEALLLLIRVGIQGKVSFRWRGDWISWVGLLFILYALVIYPLLGTILGHTWPANPTFGAPCPTTIFTFGMLLFARGKCRLPLTILPFLWALVGTSAAFTLGIREDLGLIVAGLFTLVVVIVQRKRAE